MTFDLSGFTSSPYIGLPAGPLGFGLVAAFALALLATLYWSRDGWRSLVPRQWAAAGGLALAGVLLAQLFVLRFPAELLPLPGLAAEPRPPGLPVFALVPAFLAAGWVGAGPAILVGFLTGLSRSAWETASWATPFEYGLVAAFAAAFLRQDYRGGWLSALRRPWVVGLALGALLWPILYLSYFVNVGAVTLPAADYVNSLVLATAPLFVGQVVLAGLGAELARAGLPRAWVQRRGLVPPPYLHSLNRRLLFLLIPLFIAGMAALSYADVTVALRVSTTLSIRQMEQAASAAGRDIPFFIQTGNSLLQEIANSQDWFEGDSLKRTASLLQSMRALPYFKQLILLDPALKPAAVAGYRLGPAEAADLSGEEWRLADLALRGIPQSAVEIVSDADGQTQAEVVFVLPVKDLTTRQPIGVLLGRADLAGSPLLQSTFGNLAGVAGGAGAGFLVDERGRIIYHPDPAWIGQPFQPAEDPENLQTALAGARAYRDRGPDGTRRLVLVYDSPGYPWSVVIVLPNWIVLELAAEIGSPIILLLLAIGALGLVGVAWVAGQVTRPAESLAAAAQRISEDQLDRAVIVAGPDEIGRAGQAFERMRQRLRARLYELNLLLKTSQGAAGSLHLEDTLPAILEAARAVTCAAGVRLVLAPAEGGVLVPGAPGTSFSAGPAAELMAPLDLGILELTRAEGRVVIEHVARARAVLDVAPVAGRLQALVTLPLRQEAQFVGALWLGFDRPHPLAEAESNFLETLAGQAALAVANARLFQAAEQGRQRLAAILASTPDAVVVTDPAQRVLLLNPAAAAVFELAGQTTVGRPIAEVLPHRDLARLIQAPLAGPGPSTGEFRTAAGRTLHASVSPMVSADGEALGRVCILRDVTHFKELDMMKSEFVATVSHDLRAPLTFMRGYATMLPMVGALSEKQREFADKITSGIEQMTKLIDDLLDLGRIEAGVGLAQEPCALDELVHSVVQAAAPAAANKGLQLQAEIPADFPLAFGDPALLRQAIGNLVDNAVKFTPSGGQVRVQALAAPSAFRVAVVDNGVGVAPADQAHLFERFFRVKQQGALPAKGAGLGLAIVKSIVERHGGRVWVESRLGKGSTFHLEIPRPGPAAADSGDGSARLGRGAGGPPDTR